MSKQGFFLFIGIFFSAVLLGQNSAIGEFDEEYANLGSLEVLNSPATVKPNGSITIPFDEADSVYDIMVLDTVKYSSLYNCYIVDSTYDALANAAFLKVVYYEKQSFEKLAIGSSYRIVTFRINPDKFLYEGDTISASLSSHVVLAKRYKRDCEDYSSGSKKQIENCIPVQYIYYEIVKIVALDDRSIKSKN